MLFTAVDKVLQHATWARSSRPPGGGRRAAARACTPQRRSSTTSATTISSIFFFVLVAVSMVIGMPIAFAFLVWRPSPTRSSARRFRCPIVPGRVSEGMSHMVLLAVPMFMLLGALIEIAGLATGDDRLPGFPDRPFARRPAIRAARRDVSRLRHLGREGGRHGGDCAGSVSRNEEARQHRGRPRLAALGLGGHVGDDPAIDRADHRRVR